MVVGKGEQEEGREKYKLVHVDIVINNLIKSSNEVINKYK